ncbi:hypothetical protein MC885_019304 [Smutsia gigantea]|nr:hypothetical protein MC885_019304 [Smutsia gigantea]
MPCEFSYPGPAYGTVCKGADITHDPPVATNKPGQKQHERTQGRFFLLGDPQATTAPWTSETPTVGVSRSYFFRMEKYLKKHCL